MNKRQFYDEDTIESIRNHKEIELLNYLKGGAIVLVVLCHVLQGIIKVCPQYDNSIIKYFTRMIYSFHMPIFFVISGLLFANSDTNNPTNVLKRKIIDLGIPYILGSLLFYACGLFTGEDTYNLDALKNCWHMPMSHFWFIYILLCIYIILFTLGYRTKYLQFILGVCLILHSLYFYSSIKERVESFFQFERLLYYFVFFLFGELIVSKMIYLKILKKNIIYLVASVFIFVFLFSVSEKCSLYDIPMIKVIIAFAGMYSFMQFVMYITRVNFFIRKTLRRLGKETLPIYLIHNLFTALSRKIMLFLGIDDFFLLLIVGTFFAIIIPYALSMMGEHIWAINILFYPRKVIRKK